MNQFALMRDSARIHNDPPKPVLQTNNDESSDLQDVEKPKEGEEEKQNHGKQQVPTAANSNGPKEVMDETATAKNIRGGAKEETAAVKNGQEGDEGNAAAKKERRDTPVPWQWAWVPYLLYLALGPPHAFPKEAKHFLAMQITTGALERGHKVLALLCLWVWWGPMVL
ncbi:expressed unknown protein [Seminavis robusta]|uniref:Uncharacterized protein n=1 Tax=Seminavis robusta TaxID=568900 RepID=A0A9N8EN82_9STRA|nr:expressed unknown protein [Seminavis robusta]|eukprot:Sro1413_g270570.1 n/a (168) ;mRNA; f:12503-13006